MMEPVYLNRKNICIKYKHRRILKDFAVASGHNKVVSFDIQPKMFLISLASITIIQHTNGVCMLNVNYMKWHLYPLIFCEFIWNFLCYL